MTSRGFPSLIRTAVTGLAEAVALSLFAGGVVAMAIVISQ